MTQWSDDSAGDFTQVEREMLAAEAMTTTFSASLREMQGSLQAATLDLGRLERGFSHGLRRAIDGLVLDGESLGTVFHNLAAKMSQTIYGAAVQPVANHLGGMMAQGLNGLVGAMMPFAAGGAFTQGRVMPFADGGVVSQATAFPLRGGMGLMGEAGPEAILPLSRGADGRLGVRAAGGAASGPPLQVTINVATPDLRGFQQSQSQIAEQMARLLGRADRNR